MFNDVTVVFLAGVVLLIAAVALGQFWLVCLLAPFLTAWVLGWS